MTRIRKKDGIHLYDGEIVLDSRSAQGGVNLVSHAHADHMLRNNDADVVCSDQTAEICRARFGSDFGYSTSHERIDLLDSGHIVGSSAALIDEKILFTGDVCTRDRLYLEGFKPVKAETLVLETTFGIPAYRFPPHREVERSIVDWIQDNDSPLFLFGYSLGRAQKLQKIAEKASNRPVFVHEKVMEMNKAVESVHDVKFNSSVIGDGMPDNGIYITPTGLARNDDWNKKVGRMGGLKAGFSGWAATESYRYRGGYDAAFPLSDHCDFDELVELVRAVDPEKVYTHHGFDEAFARYIQKDFGINARPLKSNQSSLDEF